MEENSYLPDYSDDDVLLFGSEEKPVMFKVKKLREAVKKAFEKSPQVADTLREFLNSQGVQIDPGGKIIKDNYYKDNLKWFGEGIDCEILKLGANGWKKGKARIRINLEFCPHEPEIEETATSDERKFVLPESPLDDIRRMMNGNN